MGTMSSLGNVQAKLDQLESTSRQVRMDVNLLQARSQPAQPISLAESLDETDWFCSQTPEQTSQMNHLTPDNKGDEKGDGKGDDSPRRPRSDGKCTRSPYPYPYPAMATGEDKIV